MISQHWYWDRNENKEKRRTDGTIKRREGKREQTYCVDRNRRTQTKIFFPFLFFLFLRFRNLSSNKMSKKEKRKSKWPEKNQNAKDFFLTWPGKCCTVCRHYIFGRWLSHVACQTGRSISRWSKRARCIHIGRSYLGMVHNLFHFQFHSYFYYFIFGFFFSPFIYSNLTYWALSLLSGSRIHSLHLVQALHLTQNVKGSWKFRCRPTQYHSPSPTQAKISENV